MFFETILVRFVNLIFLALRNAFYTTQANSYLGFELDNLKPLSSQSIIAIWDSPMHSAKLSKYIRHVFFETILARALKNAFQAIQANCLGFRAR